MKIKLPAVIAGVVLVFSWTQDLFAGARPKHVVLVPGFFNSAIPGSSEDGNPWRQPYFSRDIIDGLVTAGYRPWVADNLNPVGSIEENGQRLVQFLVKKSADFGNDSVILVGHSAGGLYALWALSSHGGIEIPLDIHRLVTVGTPFLGLDFLKSLERKGVPVQELITPFCLKNVMGLTEEKVHDFLSSIQFQKPLRIDSFAGYQPTGSDFWNFQVLSGPLRFFQLLIAEPSDGIVSVRSALGLQALNNQNHNQNEFLSTYIHRETIDLEHWELSADYRILKLSGVLNTSPLRREQRSSYVKILRAAGL